MDERKQIIRDIPFLMWAIGLTTIGIGIYGFITDNLPMISCVIIIVVGILMVLVVPMLTVYVDRSRRVLEIERISILGINRIELPFDKIQSIFMDRRFGTDSNGDRSVTYQVILMMQDGEKVPLRKSYSSSKRKHERFAETIREEIGLDQVDRAPESMGEALAMAMQLRPVSDQETLTGVPVGEQVSNGVHWQLETFEIGEPGKGSTVHRWSSRDVDIHNGFVYIVQRMEGVGQQSGLMKLAGNFLFRSSIQIFGFDESYTPGIAQAKTVEDVDRRLVKEYFIYTNDPSIARQLLNPWMVMPLVGWAERYALQRGDRDFHQLSVLFSPLGLFVSQLGKLERAEVDELVSLGVELVRAK